MEQISFNTLIKIMLSFIDNDRQYTKVAVCPCTGIQHRVANLVFVFGSSSLAVSTLLICFGGSMGTHLTCDVDTLQRRGRVKQVCSWIRYSALGH